MVRAHRLSYLALVVVVGVALGLPAAPAPASTAQLIDVVLPPECKNLPPGVPCLPGSANAVVYRASAGEANRSTLAGGSEELRISDAGAVIEARTGCSSIDRHSVRCSAPESGVLRVFVATGAGPDIVRSRLTGYVIVDGGSGDDVLLGGPGGDRLHGGKGADVLRGGDGADGLYDASPRRPLRSGNPDPFHEETVLALANPGRGPDSFDGDSGSDTVSYRGRLAGVRVDLALTAAVDGARREHDSVRNVESAVGGAGDDRLAGNNRRTNELDGGDGDDRMVGRRGADYIEGGAGRNVIIAGPGNDYINSPYRPSDQGAERIFCGSGVDSVSWIFPSDFSTTTARTWSSTSSAKVGCSAETSSRYCPSAVVALARCSSPRSFGATSSSTPPAAGSGSSYWSKAQAPGVGRPPREPRCWAHGPTRSPQTRGRA